MRKVLLPSPVAAAPPAAPAHETQLSGPARPPLDLPGTVPPAQATHCAMPVRGPYWLRVHGAHWVAAAGSRVAVEVSGLLALPLQEEAVPRGQGTICDWGATPARDSSM